MNGLAVFQHEQFGDVQVIEFEGAIYFNPDTVAKALGYKDADSMLQVFVNIPQKDMSLYIRHFTYQELNQLAVKGEVYKSQQTNLSPNGKRFLTEAGIYYLLIRSEKPNAYPFQKWVTAEVLPAIRKTGIFSFDDVFQKLQNDGLSLPPEQSLYVIRDESGNVKIGISADPYARLKQLQCGNAEKLTLVLALDNKTLQDEKALHKALAKFNVRGEWFKDSILASFEA